MMQPAIILTHGKHAVELVPSLRAATLLERLHGGFPALLARVQAFNLATILEIIKTAAPTAAPILEALHNAPLRTIRNVTLGPIVQLLSALMMTGNESDDTTAPAQAPDAKPVAWAELFKQLYKIATGWLGWTPATAWAATIQEITEAFDGMIERIKATSGTAEDDDTGPSIEQRQANIDAGLDPEFDRAGLQALKARHT